VDKSISLSPQFLASLKKLGESDLVRIEEALDALPGSFRRPHQHIGLSIRRMRKNVYECRAGLKLRIIFNVRGDALDVLFVGNHDEVKRIVRSL
jgi:mRNA-degrading endonuclease RelE of RelBE toxin-antitoxin system